MASVVASLPLTSPLVDGYLNPRKDGAAKKVGTALITPSTGEAEPRGSSCVLYDNILYNTYSQYTGLLVRGW